MDNNFKPITTQEELNALLTSRLQRERETIIKNFSDYEEIKSKLETFEKENNDLKNQVNNFVSVNSKNEEMINTLTSKIKAHETASVKTRIALEMGFPYEVAERLVGDNEEEIKKDALKFQSFMKPNIVAPIASNEIKPDAELTAYKELLNKLK